VSLAWPAREASELVAELVPPPRATMVRFGYLAGAALLVMRPAPRLQQAGSIGRVDRPGRSAGSSTSSSRWGA
jgi:hypothetical protein